MAGVVVEELLAVVVVAPDGEAGVAPPVRPCAAGST
jgi:hypothetical protein